MIEPLRPDPLRNATYTLLNLIPLSVREELSRNDVHHIAEGIYEFLVQWERCREERIVALERQVADLVNVIPLPRVLMYPQPQPGVTITASKEEAER